MTRVLEVKKHVDLHHTTLKHFSNPIIAFFNKTKINTVRISVKDLDSIFLNNRWININNIYNKFEVKKYPK